MRDMGVVLYGQCTSTMGCLDPRVEITAGAKLIVVSQIVDRPEGEVKINLGPGYAKAKEALDRYCDLKAWQPPLVPDFVARGAP
jgi:hypothetical protein